MEYNLSPMPYGGGTIQANNISSDICMLSDSRFIGIFTQIYPNFTIVAVWKPSNVGETIMAFPAPKQRAIAQEVLNNTRLWRLSANKALLYTTGKFRILEVTEDDDVIVHQEVAAPFSHGIRQAVGNYSQGVTFYGVSTDENTVLITYLSGTDKMALIKVSSSPTSNVEVTELNPSLKMLRSTSLPTWPSFVKIPNTNKIVLYYLDPSQSTYSISSSSSSASVYVMNNDGSNITTLDISPGTKSLFPMREDKFIGFYSNRAYYEIDTSTGSYSGAHYFATLGNYDSFSLSIPLDENTSLCGFGPHHSYSVMYRIFKYVQPGFAVTSSNYASGEGIQAGILERHTDQHPYYHSSNGSIIFASPAWTPSATNMFKVTALIPPAA